VTTSSLLSVAEAAELGRCGIDKIWRCIRSGELPSHKNGARRWILRHEAERFFGLVVDAPPIPVFAMPAMDAAHSSGIDPATFTALLNSGEIASITLPDSRRVVPVEALQQWLRDRAAAEAQAIASVSQIAG
jgi:excisionase family DNA binding protein